MENKIVIPYSICERLKEISSYYYNYYRLPKGMLINGCNTVLVIYHENENFVQYALGNLEEGKFNEFKRPNYFFTDCVPDYERGREVDLSDDNIIIDFSSEGKYPY